MAGVGPHSIPVAATALSLIRSGQGGSQGGSLTSARVSPPEEESAHCRACERET